VSAEQREADIAAGSERPADELRAWITSSARALAADLDELGDGPAWEATVLTAQGLRRSASEIPWMRDREVWIHAVDLRAGTTWGDLPPDFVTALLDDVTSRRSVTGGGPALAVAATDTGSTWKVAGTGVPVPVSAPLADLAGYLTGRDSAAVPAAPVLPPWL
jgi:maleylpyruvate isomerase